MNYQCSTEFIIALRDIAQICEENNTDNLRLSFDLSDDRELCVDISFEVKENNDDKKHIERSEEPIRINGAPGSF